MYQMRYLSNSLSGGGGNKEMMENRIKIQIDNREIQLEIGETVLQAAIKLDINIPTLCHYEGLPSHTSCMMCLVKDAKTGNLFASCGMPASDGMDIISKDEEVIEARKTALELLLSDHVGDCEAPCKLSCPAHMDIPQMNRLLEEGKFEEAMKVVMEDIPLPSILGRICPAPCEKVCKRKEIDEAVSICILKRYAGDYGRVEVEMSKGLKVEGRMSNVEGQQSAIAVIGAGPAGLSAAYYLNKKGYQVTVFEKEPKAGGELRNSEVADRLPSEVLDREIKFIQKTGIDFQFNKAIDSEQLKELRQNFKAVIIATGIQSVTSNQQPATSNQSPESRIPEYTIGSALRETKMAIQAVAQGKEAAVKVDQYLKGEEVLGERKIFNSRFGKLSEPEFEEYLKESVKDNRYEPETISKGFSRAEVMSEAARCLHCDCRKLTSCKLRDYSDEYAANQRRYFSTDRQMVTKNIQQDVVIYEPAKCIKCGICVRITKQHKEKYGFTFIGRGFDVQIQIPFGESLAEGLKDTAKEVAKACPTGAISDLL